MQILHEQAMIALVDLSHTMPPMTAQIFGLILIVLGIFDLALAGVLRSKLRKLPQTPPRLARWVVIITYIMGGLAILAGILVLLLG